MERMERMERTEKTNDLGIVIAATHRIDDGESCVWKGQRLLGVHSRRLQQSFSAVHIECSGRSRQARHRGTDFFANLAGVKLNKSIMTKEELMRKAIELSVKNVAEGGGPFGAVIARDGEIVATGVNRVTDDNDPTAHAEVSAIRAACRKLGTFDLSGCEIYTSCEPCPMCLGAIYWAHLDRMYYGNDKHDAARIGFDDAFIYEELDRDPSQRRLRMQELLPDEAYHAFEMWEKKSDKVEY